MQHHRWAPGAVQSRSDLLTHATGLSNPAHNDLCPRFNAKLQTLDRSRKAFIQTPLEALNFSRLELQNTTAS
jgi:hypothetical protein